MKSFVFGLSVVLSVLLFFGMATAAEPNLPVIKGKKVVATVNEEAITLGEYNRELASLLSPDSKEEENLLRRLINSRLIVQEGKRSGLDELPEIKQRVDVFSRVTLREELMERQAGNIKPDPKEVERLYKESVKEWKMSSGLFEQEDTAKALEKGTKEGKDFEKTLRKLISDGKAKESEFGKYFKNRELMPEVATALSKMKVGEVSPVVRLKTGFVVLRLEGVRYPEDKEARERARQEVLTRKQRDMLTKYNKDLMQKYATINQKLLTQLDFESKEPGFQNLLKDKRVVAEIKGEKPVTVGDLAEQLRQQLYHGVERAIEGKRVNKRKTQVLDEIIHKRVFMKEALRLGIDKTDRYKSRVKEHEDSLIFGAYVQKAVVPEVKLQEKELETYYNDHLKEYTYPEMMKIDSLVFTKRRDTEDAIEKLRKGVEIKWLRDNAEGQLDSNTPGLLNLEGKHLTVKDLPDDLRKAVAGTRSGDLRLYESSQGHFYALVIQEVVPSRPQPYQEAREEIARKVYNEKMKKAIEDLADKLRALSDVKIYLKN
jgi:hypothetical protein